MLSEAPVVPFNWAKGSNGFSNWKTCYNKAAKAYVQKKAAANNKVMKDVAVFF